MSYRHSKSKSEELSEYAMRIKRLREEHNESQEELANAIYCTKFTIANIEQGKSSPSLETVKKIAQHYNVSTDFICGLSDNVTISTNVLETLCRYISLEIRRMSMSQSHEIPFISISKNFFDYLDALAKSEQFKKNVPDEVINAWLEKEAEKAKISLRGEKNDTVRYALLCDRYISSDEVMALLEKTYRESGE